MQSPASALADRWAAGQRQRQKAAAAVPVDQQQHAVAAGGGAVEPGQGVGRRGDALPVDRLDDIAGQQVQTGKRALFTDRGHHHTRYSAADPQAGAPARGQRGEPQPGTDRHRFHLARPALVPQERGREPPARRASR